MIIADIPLQSSTMSLARRSRSMFSSLLLGGNDRGMKHSKIMSVLASLQRTMVVSSGPANPECEIRKTNEKALCMGDNSIDSVQVDGNRVSKRRPSVQQGKAEADSTETNKCQLSTRSNLTSYTYRMGQGPSKCICLSQVLVPPNPSRALLPFNPPT